MVQRIAMISVENIVKKYSHLISKFLNISGTSLLIQVDENYVLTFCNSSLINKMNLPEKPIGIDLNSILSPLENNELTLTVSRYSNGMVPQIFKLTNSEELYRCYTYKIDNGYLILGDKTGSTENEVLESMSHLNNELAGMSRELSKKNRELKRANDKIAEMARTDYLTGLFNRSYFQKRFKEFFDSIELNNEELTVLLADLDYFKKVNDDYGHDIGDKVLKMFGSVIKKKCRKNDLAARFGGEEFILLLPKTSEQEAQQLAKRFREEIINYNILPGSDYITFSAGIAMNKKSDSQEDLLKRVDNALYEAKKKGRDCWVISS